MLKNTSKLNELVQLKEHLKEYLYLYYMTKNDEYKVIINRISNSIRRVESTLVFLNIDTLEMKS